MDTNTAERQELASRLVRILSTLRNFLVLYNACHGDYMLLQQALKVWDEQRHILEHIAKVWDVEAALKEQNLSDEEYRNWLDLAFVDAVGDWVAENPTQKISDGEIFWWVVLTETLDTDISQRFWIPLFQHTIDKNPELFSANFDRMKRDGSIPNRLSAEDYAALLLDQPQTKFNLPPYHPLFLCFGVKTLAEWQNLGTKWIILLLAEWVKTGEIAKVFRSFLYAKESAFQRQGLSDKLVYMEPEQVRLKRAKQLAGLSHEEVRQAVVDELANDLSKAEIQQAIIAELRQVIIDEFAKRGIDYNALTSKEWGEIFERHDLFHEGYELSSKLGVSMSSFYGEDAHAKEQKLSRIRLKIKRIREMKTGQV